VAVPPAERKTSLDRSETYRAHEARREDGHRSLATATAGTTATRTRGGLTTRAPVDRLEHPELHRSEVGRRRPDAARAPAARRPVRDRRGARRGLRRRDRPRPRRAAFVFACEHHADQRRKSGEDFIVHPVGVAKICAGMRLDTETLVAALLHDTVEDTSATLDEVRAEFGEEVASLVDGVTKLTGITFQSRDEAQAENYRKMVVAMAEDIRVILIKLADRLHNMRTIGAMPKNKQIDKAKETLEIFAPIAHRLGIHALKWELEDLAFQALHPRKYTEIKGLVNQQREERETYVDKAGEYLRRELEALGIEAEISGRAKHFYSIYSKMTKKGREFNEIYDLTAMRVIVGSVKDCYGAVGVIHSLWKPLPGRFKDFIAMPKFNMYQSLHTTVIGPEGLPLEIQIRTREMHDMAEFGVAAHWIYKNAKGPKNGAAPADGEQKLKWLRHMLDWQQDLQDPKEFMETLKVDLFDEEVFVFTPKGEVKSLASGATPLDFAYEVHTEIGHRCVGARVNGKIVPLHYELRSGDIVEVLTANKDRGPSRDWLSVVKTTRRATRSSSGSRPSRARTPSTPAASCCRSSSTSAACRRRRSPARRCSPTSSARWASARPRSSTSRSAARRSPRRSSSTRSCTASSRARPPRARRRRSRTSSRPARAPPADPLERQYGIRVEGVEDVMLRLAKCCHPVPGDPIAGYISLGRGITIHRDDCPNVATLRKDPERFVSVSWEGDHETAFKVEIEVDAYDRTRLLEELSRTFAESGINIVEARCVVSPPMVKNRFVVEVGDTHTLKATITRLRNIDSVFDAYRVTPNA
jgi:GTP pyrophosphokinase